MGSRGGKRVTVAALLGVLGAMVGLTAASVPLYRIFCQATGYQGTTQNAAAAPTQEITGKLITVRFDANTAPGLGWEFRPLVASVQVHPGEEKVIAYRATNLTKLAETGTATHNVTPLRAGIYFDKLQCFCFTKQHLAPGQSVDLAVSFFVDPDIVRDPNTRDVDAITLSYTMFRAQDDTPERRPAGAAQTASRN
jgi:cytochrome c oxidase assembly protein subunit 11